MKRMIASALLVSLLLSLLLPACILPTGAEEKHITTDKTTYSEGEPILITATGDGADWVGLYLADELYDSNNGGMVSIYWYYVAKEGNSSGDTKNIFDSEYNNFAGRPEYAAGLPAGEYKVVLMENDGFVELDRAEFTIVEGKAPGAPEAGGEPTDQNPLVTDKTEYLEGEPILVKALGSGLDWVGLYLDGETPPTGNPPSIYWFYVAQDGNTPGQAVNLREQRFSTDRAAYGDIPAGDYRLVLCRDDGYAVRAEVAITVKEDPASKPPVTKPAAPASAVYKSANAGAGRADGTLTITHGGQAPAYYTVRWGNASGALNGYTDIATVPCKGTETVYKMTPDTLIPAGADRILVYAQNGDILSDTAAIAALPAGAGTYDLGKLCYELQVMSDIHINPADSHIHNRHFASALADIKKLSPGSLGIFVNGDIADHGQATEYAAFRRLIQNAGDGVPPVFCAIGNHDWSTGSIAPFLAGAGMDTDQVYFEREVNGVHFIFLGSEDAGTSANLSSEQLKWLSNKLDAYEESGEPVFIFLHQGIMDTVAGTFEYQGWHGVNQGNQLKKILAQHPEAVLFSGHSHWTLESKQSVLPATDKFPTVLNTSSCAYLWDDDANITNRGITGSQGYYIYVYERALVFLGRNFDTGEWVASAQFIVPRAGAETPVETTPDTAPLTDPVTDPLAPSTDTLPESAPGGTDTPATETEPTAGGCASAVAVGSLLLLGLVAAPLLLKKKD